MLILGLKNADIVYFLCVLPVFLFLLFVFLCCPLHIGKVQGSAQDQSKESFCYAPPKQPNGSLLVHCGMHVQLLSASLLGKTSR